MIMNQWMVPSNPKYYDVDGALHTLRCVDWKQRSAKVQVGDLVYIYVSAPVSAVRYLCRVKAVNKPSSTIDDSAYVINGEPFDSYPRKMELELIAVCDSEMGDFNHLSEHGLKGKLMTIRRADGELAEYLKTIPVREV